MKINKKTIICSIAAIIGVFVLLIGLLYWQRNHIIEHIAKDKFAKIESSRNVKLSFDKMNLSGLDNLIITAFKLQEPNKQTFLYIDSLDCKLSLLGMLKREVVITNMAIKNIDLNVIDKREERNFGFLLHSNENKPSESAENNEKRSMYERVTEKLNKVFDIFPEDLKIRNMNINLVHNNYDASLSIPEFNIIDNEFNSQANLKCLNSETQSLKLTGSFSNQNQSFKCDVSSANKERLRMPLVDTLYNAIIKSDTLHFSIQTNEVSDQLELVGNLGFSGLCINHKRLSDRDLEFGNGAINYHLNVKDNVFELDSASTIHFNRFNFHPYLKLELQPCIKVTASINKETFPADELFSSLPNGLFVNLDSLQTTGDLDYHFFLQVDEDNIDSLKFESALNKHPNFKIVKFGRTDFREIGKPFMYDARDHGTLVRSFKIGPEWQNFRPLDSISIHLQNAVMISEDGFFYTHKGFYEGAIQYSLIQNIKQKRFARGGSTISMQLVKNLFLNNNKNLMRKVEEILIVWLIENERLVSKRRMYEIYLNIIEWGPNHKVYGAEEAAQFYFNKHANQITADEAIFLAAIVPSPKKFMYRFDETHKLRPSMDFYYKLIGGKMVSRGFITGEAYEALSREKVEVTGAAVSWLPKLKVKPEVADSLLEAEGESLLDLE